MAVTVTSSSEMTSAWFRALEARGLKRCVSRGYAYHGSFIGLAKEEEAATRSDDAEAAARRVLETRFEQGTNDLWVVGMQKASCALRQQQLGVTALILRSGFEQVLALLVSAPPGGNVVHPPPPTPCRCGCS